MYSYVLFFLCHFLLHLGSFAIFALQLFSISWRSQSGVGFWLALSFVCISYPPFPLLLYEIDLL